MTLVRCALALSMVPTLLAAPSRMAGALGEEASSSARYATLRPSMARAMELLREKHVEEAKAILLKCVDQMPDHHMANFQLALLAYEAKDFQGALGRIEIAERSLESLEQRLQAERQQLSAEIDKEQAAMQDSLDELTARGVDPTGCQAGLYIVKGNIIRELSARKESLGRDDATLGGLGDYRYLHGNCLYRLGRPAEARDQYLRALQADPAHELAWNNLLGLDLETGKGAEAKATLVKADALKVKVRPNLRAAVAKLAVTRP